MFCLFISTRNAAYDIVHWCVVVAIATHAVARHAVCGSASWSPAGDLELPTDIYEEDVVIVDDGYDRSKLNFPGVMHVELAAKWTQEFPSPRPGGSNPFVAALAAVLGAPSPLQLPAPPGQPQAQFPAAPAAKGSGKDRLAIRQLKRGATDGSAVSDGEPENQTDQIMQNTVKAMGLQRWSSSDKSQPNTVEFWVRIFTTSVTKTPVEECPLRGPRTRT